MNYRFQPTQAFWESFYALSAFFVEGDLVVTVDIGSHDIYNG